MPNEKTVLEEAIDTVDNRAQTYGGPEDSFRVIAEFWTSYLGGQITRPLTSRQVAMLMVLLKVARDIHKDKRDNLVDIAGYARCAELVSVPVVVSGSVSESSAPTERNVAAVRREHVPESSPRFVMLDKRSNQDPGDEHTEPAPLVEYWQKDPPMYGIGPTFEDAYKSAKPFHTSGLSYVDGAPADLQSLGAAPIKPADLITDSTDLTPQSAGVRHVCTGLACVFYGQEVGLDHEHSAGKATFIPPKCTGCGPRASMGYHVTPCPELKRDVEEWLSTQVKREEVATKQSDVHKVQNNNSMIAWGVKPENK